MSISDPIHEPLEVSLKRWQSTAANDFQGMRQVLSRVYTRINRPAPFVIWCDSPWQLAVAPFLMRLVCFSPSDAQRRMLNQSYDYRDLCRTIRRELQANLNQGLWQQALESIMSQLPPELELALMGTSIDRQDPDEKRKPSTLELAASHLSEHFDLEGVNYPEVLNKIETETTSSAFQALQQRWKALIPEYREELPERLDPELPIIRPTPHSREVAGLASSRIAFERKFRADTGVSIKDFDGSEVPSLGASDLLALQFQKQMGSKFCDQICRLLTSNPWSDLVEALDRAIGSFLPPKFLDDNPAVLANLRESDILAIARSLRRCQPVWTNWSLYYLSISMLLNKPDWKDRAEFAEELVDYWQMSAGAFMYVFEDKVVYACKNPTAFRFDERERFHSYTEPAVEFVDGYKMYSWRGIMVNEELACKPEILTVKYIDNERNVEVRRVLIERYGTGNYIIDSGAVAVASDDVGVLYTKQISGDEMIVVVKVINSTPEPDGTYKQYFLRVPPNISTPRAGIAWTFGLRPEEYHPAVQT